jgi:pimeloyl-ACP methyl ester carboxylesterase
MNPNFIQTGETQFLKPQILLLHGALGTKKQLAETRLSLLEYFDVYVLDFEGHGDFSSEKEFSIDLFTENVISFLDQHSIEKIHLFGYSMGGYVALKTALKIPGRIGKIVTFGTKFNWDASSTEKEISMLNPDKIEEKVPHFAQKLKTEHPSNNWKEIVLKTARMMKGLSAGNTLSEAELKAIPNEVLIGWGTLDKMVSREESEQVAQILNSGTFKILEGLEHPIEKIDTKCLSEYIVGSILNSVKN